MSQVQIPNSDHCIWPAWINHLCKSGLDHIDCKSRFCLKCRKGWWSKACNIKTRIFQISFPEWWNTTVLSILKVFSFLHSSLRFSPHSLTLCISEWFALCFNFLCIGVVVVIIFVECSVFTKKSIHSMNLVLRVFFLALLLWDILSFSKWSIMTVRFKVFICSFLILDCVHFVETFH